MEGALREALTSAMLRYFDRPEVIGHLIETARAELAKLQCAVPGERTQAEKALAATRTKSPKDARVALKHLLDDGIELHPLEGARYRARWTVRGGTLFSGGTTKPPVQTEGLEERSTLWVAGAGYAQRRPVECGVPMEVVMAA